jgi:hypothetical protein
VETISGLKWWPAAVDPDAFRSRFSGRIPLGVHRCVIPAAIDAWLTALARHGTMRYAEAAEAAIDLAETGFPVHTVMHETLSAAGSLKAMQDWPSTHAIFLDKSGTPRTVGSVLRQRDLALTLQRLAEAEAGAREAGIAATIAATSPNKSPILWPRRAAGSPAEILQNSPSRWNRRCQLNYRGYDVHSCGPWCQGPVVLMALNILEGYDLAQMEPGSTDVYHLVLEALKAAFADRDRYFGSPRHVRVPMDGLLSKHYAPRWHERIALTRAAPGMPEPGLAVLGPATGAIALVLPGADIGAGGAQYQLSLRGRCRRQRVLRHAERRRHRHPDHSGIGMHRFQPRHAILVGPRSSQHDRATQAVAADAKPGNGAEGWQACDALRHARQRRAAANDGAISDQRHRLRHGCAGGDRGAASSTFSFPRSSDPHPYSPGAANIEGRVERACGAGPQGDQMAGVDGYRRIAGRDHGRSSKRRAPRRCRSTAGGLCDWEVTFLGHCETRATPKQSRPRLVWLERRDWRSPLKRERTGSLL